MSSAVDIHIVSTPNLEKIESFLKDSTYRETIEFSANFNTRLCIERRLRLPFLDPQTGVAQNHSNLFMDKRQRMPGFRQGQIYTYPSARWRKSRRQYLSKMYRFPDRPFQSFRKDAETFGNGPVGVAGAAAAATSAAVGGAYPLTASGSAVSTVSATTVSVPIATGTDPDFSGTLLEESSSLGGAGDTSDSKDSQQHLKEELPKEWFYDDMDINEMDSLEEPKSPADDEYDYDPRYGNKKRKKRRPGKKSLGTPTESSRKRQSTGSRGGSGVGGAGGAATSGAGVDGAEGGSGGRASGSRGGGRGRRKPKESAASRLNAAANPPSPAIEPPSFETAAAAVGSGAIGVGGVGDLATDEHGELRNYRKYL